MSKDCDVLVVGAGGAGLSAAIAAADRGASVIVLEAGKKPGGSTALSGGVFYAAATSVQEKCGISDSVERMYHYYMTLNQWNLEPWLVRRFCDESAPTLNWLIKLGVEFPPEELYISGVEDVPRGHSTKGHGQALFEVLYGASSARGVACHSNVRVESLIVEAGRVVGVRAQGAEMRAGAVVLACGGYGANMDILKEFNPAVAAMGDWVFYFGAETNRGDAVTMGRAIGAAIAGKGRLMLNESPGFSRDVANFHPPWMVFVNKEGRRFMDETAPYAVSGDLIVMQPQSRCFAVFDDVARASSPTRHPFADKLGLGDYVWSGERILQEAVKGRVMVADTIDELAGKLGIHVGALKGTLAAYNADVALGKDRHFLKEGLLRAVATPPFFGVELRPCSYGATVAGLRIDPDTRVYDTNETPIPGLYAAGEATGGVVGDRYIGGGNFISNAIIYGRIAGQNAAAFAGAG